MTTFKKGDRVRHKVYLHRGLGWVKEIGKTLLPTQQPKVLVSFERGGPCTAFPTTLRLR